MTALSAPGSAPRKGEALIERYGVKGNVIVYTSANLVFNGGYVQPAAGLASLPYAGVAREGTVVASTTDGAREIDVQRSGQVQKALSGATAADIGKEVWMTDDNVITLIPNNGPRMGRITALVSSGVVMVDITGYTAAPPAGPIHMKIPFSQHGSEYDTGYDLPSRMLVEKCFPEVEAGASGTIDIGLGAGSETGFDPDGLVDGADVTNAGVIQPVLESTVLANITCGAYLNAGTIKSADTTAIYAAVRRDHYAGSILARSVSYISASLATGYIHIIGRMI